MPRSQRPEYRKLMLKAKNEIGLTDEERMELASYLLRRDITSWSQLDDDQVTRLLDALEGYELISKLIEMRF